MSKTSENQIILAIHPNTRGFGYVFMSSARRLLDFQAVRVSPFNQFMIIHRITKAILEDKPRVVIIQDPDKTNYKIGRRVRKVVEAIKDIALKNNICIYQYSRDHIKDVFSEFGARSKFEIATLLVKEFTELARLLPEKRKFYETEPHNMPIFDALSLAITYYWVEG